MTEGLGTDALDEERDDQGDEEDEAGDLNRMMECRHGDAHEALLMMMVMMMSCMGVGSCMLVAVVLLCDMTMCVVVCIGLVRMRRLCMKLFRLFLLVAVTVLMHTEIVNMLLRCLRMAAMPHEYVEQETTDEAQYRLRRQNPQHRRRMYTLRDKNRQHLI